MNHEIYSLGLIGYPLAHSLSPVLHTAALQAVGLAGNYDLYPVEPVRHRQSDLERILAKLRSGELHGLNVTIPHKQSIIPYLDELTPDARTIGAVNTIVRTRDRLVGDNTDAPGFMSDLRRFLASCQVPPHGGGRQGALIIGAGGAARAVAYALLKESWQVWISSRRMSQAQALAKDLTPTVWSTSSAAILPLPWDPDLIVGLAPSISLIINATPLGMIPNSGTSPWPSGIPLPTRVVIYDLVYNPLETKLMRQAHAAGLPATSGMGMLVEQAALAFERWTGYRVPRNALWEAVNHTRTRQNSTAD